MDAPVHSSPGYLTERWHRFSFPESSTEYGRMSERKIVLETERLILRPWKKNKADAKELYRYARDSRVGPAAGWPVHKDPAESLEIIRRILSTPDIYAVVLKETGKPIGAAGITYGSTGRKYLKEEEAEIGYWIGAEHWWTRSRAAASM